MKYDPKRPYKRPWYHHIKREYGHYFTASNVLVAITILIIAWVVLSVFDIMFHNPAPVDAYAKWNFFTIVFTKY